MTLSPNPNNVAVPSPRPQPRAGSQIEALTRGLSLRRKLGLMAGLFLLPALVEGVTLVIAQQREISGLRQAVSVNKYVDTLNTIQSQLEDYSRIAVNAKKNGNSSPEIATLNQQVKQELQQMQQDLKSDNSTVGRALAKSLPVDNFLNDWQLFTESYPNQGALDIVDGYRSLLSDYIQPMLAKIAQQGNLEVGAGDSQAYYVQNLPLSDLPALRGLVTATGLTAQVRSLNTLNEYERNDLRSQIQNARQYLNNVVSDTQRAGENNQGAVKTLQDNSSNYAVSADQYLQSLEDILNGLPGKQIDQSTADIIKQGQQLNTTSSDTLYTILRNNLNGRQTTQLTSLAISILLALVAIALLTFILQTLLRAINNLTSGAQRLSAGQFNVRIPVTTEDEIGTVVRSFNSAAEQLQANELRTQQEREEADRLQGNIGEFLNVTMDIAEGDLTKRGKVTEDVLGNVVDSINLMTEELAAVLKDVQNASSSVTGGSRAMLSTTEQINEGTQMTAAEAARVAQQVQELTAAIREMARSAQTSAQTARQALLASQQGQEAVSGTLEGMQNIRVASQNVAQQIQGLSQRSEQIQEIVESISHIASQTNLLALHASIEAAGAGEAGQRFNIVAQEVSQLADLSAQEAQRITSLVRNVQNEISEALNTVSESTREVEQGYRVAGTAGERLREIGTLSENTAKLAEQISETTLEQVRGVEQVGQAVVQINTIAQQSAQSVEQGRSAAEQLQQLANRLNASLSRFRLPS